MSKINAMVKCKQCTNTGFKSKVKVDRTSSYGSNKECFYDENGIYHNHDKNTYVDEYRCELGHTWKKYSIDSCWCGYNKESAATMMSNVA